MLISLLIIVTYININLACLIYVNRYVLTNVQTNNNILATGFIMNSMQKNLYIILNYLHCKLLLYF